MAFTILKHLQDNDSIFSYDTKAEAETKKLELENADSTGRLYQIVEI